MLAIAEVMLYVLAFTYAVFIIYVILGKI